MWFSKNQALCLLTSPNNPPAIGVEWVMGPMLKLIPSPQRHKAGGTESTGGDLEPSHLTVRKAGWLSQQEQGFSKTRKCQPTIYYFSLSSIVLPLLGVRPNLFIKLSAVLDTRQKKTKHDTHQKKNLRRDLSTAFIFVEENTRTLTHSYGFSLP